MKILLLGGEGFIGRYFSEFLLECGHQVEVVDLRSGLAQDLRFIKLRNLHLFDRVYFLAWDVGGSKYLTNKGSYIGQFESNLKLINNIFPQLEVSEVPYLFTSSQLAGSDSTPYSLTKLTGEIMSSQHKTGWQVRQWNVYGAYEEEGIKSHVITDMIAQAVRTKKINLLTTGEEQRQFIHIQDVCAAYLDVFNHSNKEIYNITSNRWVSISEVANIVAELTNSKVTRGELLGLNPVANGGVSLPNWSAKVPLEEGIEKLVKSFQN